MPRLDSDNLKMQLRPVRRWQKRMQLEATVAMRRFNPGSRPLPRFLILGAAKAGTTSLYEYLSQHPNVRAPLVKEIHYFDHSYGRGIGWYRGYFPLLTGQQITGEATPYYLFHPCVPLRVQHHIPDARFIVLLRNPIDRLVSQHNHEFADGFDDLSLEAALDCEEQRLEGQEEELLRNPGLRSFSHQHHSYIARGCYADQLERWFGCFDREQFLVLSAEDLFHSPRAVVQLAQHHLGLEDIEPHDVTVRNARSYAAISVATRERLQATFAPHNERLYELVGRDFGWG